MYVCLLYCPSRWLSYNNVNEIEGAKAAEKPVNALCGIITQNAFKAIQQRAATWYLLFLFF